MLACLDKIFGVALPRSHVAACAIVGRQLLNLVKIGYLQLHVHVCVACTLKSSVCCRLSNLGMFGIKEFKAIINPPQAAVLAVGCAQASLQDGRVVSIMNLGLSFDCRVVEDGTAAQFLELLRGLLEDPQTMGL